MRHFTIRKGLDLPIAGPPEQAIADGPTVTRVGITGDDFIGMKPTMQVQVGEHVQCGQVVFSDKKTEGVVYTSPASGTVAAIERGEKRRFQTLVIDVDANDIGDGTNGVEFARWDYPGNLSGDEIREQLIASGLWTALRTRPFNRVPPPASQPHSLFITAIDTHPLAADPAIVIAADRDAFVQGVRVLKNLTEGRTFICTGVDLSLPEVADPRVEIVRFEGVHPAGLPGTHIHFLDPVHASKTVWFIGYQDVIAVGKLFTQGRLDVRRVVAVGGPAMSNPTLYRTRLGADLRQLLSRQDVPPDARVISGSVLSGRTAAEPYMFLGRYHLQVCALPEGREREFLGWQRPGADRFSVTKAFAGGWWNPRRFRFTTNLNGGHRAMVPIGTYERVMPMDILPTQLLRSLLTGDTGEAQALGVLELDEEDVALCTFVCPGKYDYAAILRENLTIIEKEG